MRKPKVKQAIANLGWHYAPMLGRGGGSFTPMSDGVAMAAYKVRAVARLLHNLQRLQLTTANSAQYCLRTNEFHAGYREGLLMLDRYMVGRLIDLWFAEDIGACDLTCQLMIDPQAQGAFRMNAREPMTVAGLEVAAMVFRHYDATLNVELTAKDGDQVAKGAELLKVSGAARSVLTGERTALNIVQHLSGIATETANTSRKLRVRAPD